MSRADLQSLVDRLADTMPADAAHANPPLTLGHADTDARLGGGLVVAALHEVFAATQADAVTAGGFALLLALRCQRPGPVIWLREDKARMNGRLYGLGLSELGFDPDRLLLVEAPDTLALLRAAAEAVQCAAVGAVIIEPWGQSGRGQAGRGPSGVVDLTATRRLALSASRSGVLALLLRTGDPGPSAATSRWAVRAIPSSPLPADAPGCPAFEISLLRHRSGIAGFNARVEWNRETCVFAEFGDFAAGNFATGHFAGLAATPSLPGVVPAAVAIGTPHPIPAIPHTRRAA